MSNQPKVALVHDYLREYGGGEKVLEVLNEVWPQASIYTSVYDVDRMSRSELRVPSGLIHTSFAQYFPFRNQLRKHYFFVYPLAFRKLRIDTDVILSSCSYASKFISKPKGGLHICYLHSVPKFLWGYDTETPDLRVLPVDKYLSPLYQKVLPTIKTVFRKMDFAAAQKVDFFLANSELTKKRIKKHYNRDSKVIYPPVDLGRFDGEIKDEGYYLIISRLSSFKKIDLVVRAFNKFGKSLKIVGDGQELSNLKKISHSNIEFLGMLSGKELGRILRNCSALIFPTLEDFGIVPVEAMAAGKPVLAYRGGGALETIVEGKTGEFFDDQKSESLLSLLKRFDPRRYNASDCRTQARKFSKEEFKRKIKIFVEEAWENKK
jgi:glycosyltransferase involved in cell wall biosynthesis